MKRIILFGLLFLIVNISSFSQPYHSLFAKDTTRWNMFQIVPDYASTIAYYSFSDTIINGKYYHTIYDQRLDFSNQPFGQNSLICGFIREDTISGKSWFLKHLDDTIIEVLLMDLNLKQGDTFQLISEFRHLRIEPLTVDSIYYHANRKNVELNKYFYDELGNILKLTFIEGIGPTSGFFMAEPQEWFGLFGLLCKFTNKEPIYSSISADTLASCFYSGRTYVNKNSLDDQISVFPNPTLSKINIQLKNLSYKNTQLFVFNSTGTLILNRPMTSAIDFLDISQNGIYFLKVVSGNIVLNKKIVVIGY